jgi:hypothetical protein
MCVRKIAKGGISFVLSVRPSIWNNTVSTGWISIKFDSPPPRKPVEKRQVLLLSDKNNRYFTWRRFHIYDYLAEFFLEWQMFI